MSADDQDFFAPTDVVPQAGHRWSELLTGPTTTYGKWSCVLGANLGVGFTQPATTDADRQSIKDAIGRAHCLLYGCQAPLNEVAD